MRVQDLKGGRQTGIPMMGPQEAIAQSMKGANPHATHIHRQHGTHTAQHLFGRLIGEGHRQHALGAHLARGDQPGNPGGQHPGLATTRSSQNQGRLRGQRDCCTLLWV